MCQQTHSTVGELARFFSAPDWKIRRLVDSLGVEIPRAGGYRLIPRELIPRIAAKLQPSPTVLQNAGADEPAQADHVAQPQQEAAK